MTAVLHSPGCCHIDDQHSIASYCLRFPSRFQDSAPTMKSPFSVNDLSWSLGLWRDIVEVLRPSRWGCNYNNGDWTINILSKGMLYLMTLRQFLDTVNFIPSLNWLRLESAEFYANKESLWLISIRQMRCGCRQWKYFPLFVNCVKVVLIWWFANERCTCIPDRCTTLGRKTTCLTKILLTGFWSNTSDGLIRQLV